MGADNKNGKHDTVMGFGTDTDGLDTSHAKAHMLLNKIMPRWKPANSPVEVYQSTVLEGPDKCGGLTETLQFEVQKSPLFRAVELIETQHRGIRLETRFKVAYFFGR